MLKVGIIGWGFVGKAVDAGMGIVSDVLIYDKFVDIASGSSLETVVQESDIIFLCLPTPMNEDGSCNTSIINEVANEVNKIASNSKAIIIKSTIPPGSTQALANKFTKHSWFFNPEFLTQRTYIEDFLNQDRIFIGHTKQATLEHVELVTELFEQFTNQQSEPAVIKYTESQEAEMLKYVSNCFLATKVTFFNEIYEICKYANIDYEKIIKYLKIDQRIGKTHMQVPGPDGKFGFGGSCFPKDISALIAYAQKLDIDPLVLGSVWAKNLMIRESYEWEELAQVTGEYE